MMERIDIVTKDYERTLGFIDKCDDHIFKIKNWALVTTSAVIAFSISRNQDFIVLVNLMLIPAFMYLELIYKSLQDDAIAHAQDLENRIEVYIANSDSEEWCKDYKFGFGRKLGYPSVQRALAILRNPFRRHIVNFYGLLATFSIGAFAVARYVA